MANENCLKGMRCPRCEQDERLKIEVRTVVMMYDDGDSGQGDLHWEDESYCECPECGHYGVVRDFCYDEK